MNFQGESLINDKRSEDSEDTMKAAASEEISERIEISPGVSLSQVAPDEEIKSSSDNSSAVGTQDAQKTLFPKEKLDLRRMRAHASVSNNSS